MLEENIKKVFVVTGELSGDCNAAWYVKKLQRQNCNAQFHAVGGDNLAVLGVKIFRRFEELNVVGIVEIVKHLPFILRFLKELVEHITSNGFDEVILVDFPGFNLMLAKKLKSINPKIKITYLAPPQLWCWGAWRVKKIKKYCDKVVVLYPFEVKWYKQHGMSAEWSGNPVYDNLKPYFDMSQHKERLIALVPGSRKSELERFLHTFVPVISVLSGRYPDVKFVIPVASSLSDDFIKQQFEKTGLKRYENRLILVREESEKYKLLSKCCLTITKPGTVTLELALLGVPAVMIFNVPWLTYFLGRPFVKVKYMSLPNLLLDFEVYKELIQSDCKTNLIIKEADNLYLGFLKQSNDYVMKMKKLDELRKLLATATLP